MSTYLGKGTKEEILANLDTAIGTVTGINFVDYQRDDPGPDKEQYPGCFINDIGTAKQYLLQDVAKNEFVVGLVLFVWADEGENLMTLLNAFVESVKSAIMTDPTRGSKAYSTRIDDILTDTGSNFPQAIAAMKITIIFFSSE